MNSGSRVTPLRRVRSYIPFLQVEASWRLVYRAPAWFSGGAHRSDKVVSKGVEPRGPPPPPRFEQYAHLWKTLAGAGGVHLVCVAALGTKMTRSGGPTERMDRRRSFLAVFWAEDGERPFLPGGAMVKGVMDLCCRLPGIFANLLLTTWVVGDRPRLMLGATSTLPKILFHISLDRDDSEAKKRAPLWMSEVCISCQLGAKPRPLGRFHPPSSTESIMERSLLSIYLVS